MHRQPAMRYGAATLLLAAGLAAALTLTASDANAYTIGQLPNMGFGVLMIYLPANGCHQYKVGWRNDPKTDLGSDCDPGFQQKLDAFMASHCPPFVCPENAPTTVTTTQTETDTETDVQTLPAPEPVTVPVLFPVLVPQAAPPDNDPPPPVDVDPTPPSPPHAGFSETTVAQTVHVADLKGNTNVTWSFGDGANGVGVKAVHRYAPGSYTIVETVVANGLVDQSAETVHVLDALTAHREAFAFR